MISKIKYYVFPYAAPSLAVTKVTMKIDDENIAQINTELTTVRDYIRWGLSRFNAAALHFGHGTDNAWDEIIYLITSALHLPPDIRHELLGAHLTAVERANLSDLILRRIKENIPVAYLTHQAWFAGLAFYVDQRVIIPRSPIAELIQNGFSPWLDGVNVTNILDLCTGCGCIAIACAVAFPESHVDAVDISKDALDVAAINLKKHDMTTRITLLQSNLFNNKEGQQYDLIVSNPPYVSMDEYQTLPKEYSHEPTIALTSSDQGLAIVIEILKQSYSHLTPNGLLVVEVGNSQEALTERFPEIPFLWLDFESGGHGVFLLTAQQLKEYQPLLQAI